MTTLKDIKIGQTARVTKLGGDGALRQHFLDMGIIPGTEITVVKYAPMGDPMELRLHDYDLTLRLADAGQIEVTAQGENDKDASSIAGNNISNNASNNISNIANSIAGNSIVDKKKASQNNSQKNSNAKKYTDAWTNKKKVDHPGLGEGGKFHPKGSGDPLPEGTTMRFALVGNQNSGKTTLFNRLTGSNQHVGNFPGVTVDRKDGEIIGHPAAVITDLPGIYSMSPYSNEEIVSRNFVLDEKPHAIINIVDVTNVERNLYLTMQLLELNVPMVVALNMMDELTANGGGVYVNLMEHMLGVPVVPISAAKNEGIEELVEHAIHVAYYQERPVRKDFCDKTENGGAVHRCLHGIRHLIEDHAEAAGLPLHFAASKVVEGDSLILKKLNLDSNELDAMEHIVRQMEKERGLDRNAAIADMRFSFIHKVCRESVTKPRESKEHARSRRIDKVLTGKYTAIPAFICIMGLVFWLTFNVIGAWLQEILEAGIGHLTELADLAMQKGSVNEAVRSLIIDGVFAGVGSVLSFLPIIVTLFFFLSLLEDSGYIARVAFFMDKLLRKIGLSGRSIVPMLIGFGCSVPAVMATRTLSSERDRRMTILLTPFMSCSAKLPIYAFFVNAFFPKQGGLIMVGLYVLGIVVGILAAFLYKNTLFKGEAVPFVMELPNYRLPGLRNVGQLLWEKSKDFLHRAFSIIFLATILVWLLQHFDLYWNMTDVPENSILAMIASLFVPIMKPIGLGDWRILVALVSGFMAKESVVSTLEILYGEGLTTAMTSLTAASLLVFSLLYTPCVAAVASIKRELGRKWALTVVIWQCAVAWLCALITYLIGSIL